MNLVPCAVCKKPIVTDQNIPDVLDAIWCSRPLCQTTFELWDASHRKMPLDEFYAYIQEEMKK